MSDEKQLLQRTNKIIHLNKILFLMSFFGGLLIILMNAFPPKTTLSQELQPLLNAGLIFFGLALLMSIVSITMLSYIKRQLEKEEAVSDVH